MSGLMKNISVVFASVAAAGGLYTAVQTWWPNGTEYKYEVFGGEISDVRTSGVAVKWNPLAGVESLPRQRQITNVSSDNANLRSDIGERFMGEIRLEYDFHFGEDPALQRANIENMRQEFGRNIAREIDKSLNNDYQDPIEKVVQARAQTIIVDVLNGYGTDQFTENIDEIKQEILDQLRETLDEEGLEYVRLRAVDTSGLAPGPRAQDRIDRIASERRERERAQIVIDNAEKVGEAAAEDAQVFMNFAEPLLRAGFSESAIVRIHCLTLTDKADRTNIPLAPGCTGDVEDLQTVSIDPARLDEYNQFVRDLENSSDEDTAGSPAPDGP